MTDYGNKILNSKLVSVELQVLDATAPPTEWPDMSRTAAALEEYDRFMALQEPKWNAVDDPDDLARLVRDDNTARHALGMAFYLDTADRNSASCVDSVSNDIAFVRRCVEKWKARR